MSRPQKLPKSDTKPQAKVADDDASDGMKNKRADADIQHRADQVRSSLAIPDQCAETLIQLRAEDVRNNLKIPIDNGKFPGIWNHYHDVRSLPQSQMAPAAHMALSTHTIPSHVGFTSGPLAVGALGHGRIRTCSHENTDCASIQQSVGTVACQNANLMSGPMPAGGHSYQPTTPSISKTDTSSFHKQQSSPNDSIFRSNPMSGQQSSHNQPATPTPPVFGSSPSQRRTHTDKNRRASVVKVPNPLKRTACSSSPAVPSTLRSVKFPPLESPTRSPSSDSTIDVNQTPYARRSSVSVPGCRTTSVFDDDPFVTSQPGPQTFIAGSPFNKGCASMAEKIARQVANTRSLTSLGYRGPVEVGDFICLIDPYTGQPDPIAANHPDGKGNTVIRDFRSQKDVSKIMPSDNGCAEWGRKGEFKGFEESIAAAWIHGSS
ncbi:hypothetical protein LZ30DRAFT_766690 [Colletotrichum cereale]|nr:hypothetical protein LZ30DRAFT_766690 [Colletotrichum cereale]